MSPLAERDVVWAYRTWFPILHQKCRRMLADHAEAMDVAQETEIAELLGLGERTVRRRLRAAEAHLERLGGNDG